MSKRRLFTILFFLFLLEGTVFQLINTDYYGSSISVFPRFVLISLIFISIFIEKRSALLLGLLIGLLYDIVFGRVIGVYMIGMAGIGYFGGWLIQYFHPTFSLYLFIEWIGHFAFEFYLYGMLRLFHLVQIPIDWAFSHMIIPTVMLNLLFAVFIFPFSKRWVENTGLE